MEKTNSTCILKYSPGWWRELIGAGVQVWKCDQLGDHGSTHGTAEMDRRENRWIHLGNIWGLKGSLNSHPPNIGREENPKIQKIKKGLFATRIG